MCSCLARSAGDLHVLGMWRMAGRSAPHTPSIPAASRHAARAGKPDAEWEAHLNEGWDRAAAVGVAAKLPDLEMQRESEQRPHKISYKLR